MQAYGRSKLAMVMCGYILARRLEGTGVTVNTLHPGLVTTDIVDEAAPTSSRKAPTSAPPTPTNPSSTSVSLKLTTLAVVMSWWSPGGGCGSTKAGKAFPGSGKKARLTYVLRGPSGV
jgi:NAD(P)-dependent dehydrogenase (short-subunit alcohol dehydrogenase family)